MSIAAIHFGEHISVRFGLEADVRSPTLNDCIADEAADYDHLIDVRFWDQ